MAGKKYTDEQKDEFFRLLEPAHRAFRFDQAYSIRPMRSRQKVVAHSERLVGEAD